MIAPELQALVRAACDSEYPAAACDWPKCDCLGDGTNVLAALVSAARAEEREKVAAFMGVHSLATGHGDTIEDLLGEMGWQIEELRSKVCDSAEREPVLLTTHEAIRSRASETGKDGG